MANLPPQNRRRQNESEESAVSLNTFIDRFNKLGFENALPKIELNRLLSTRSAISTKSSLAQKEQDAQARGDKTFAQIGKGCCGEIFSQPGANKVLKRAYPGQERPLWRDYCTHMRLYKAWKSSVGDNVDVMVPQCEEYATEDTDSFWLDLGAAFSAAHRTSERRHVLISQRIYPLQESIRVLLIKEFCPPERYDQAIENPANADCLARLYLGQIASSQVINDFTLRNIPLTLDRLQKLQLDTISYAKSIAQGLALLHWQAKVDARDVEFVLGTAPTTMELRTQDLDLEGEIKATRELSNFKKRAVHVWLLDFNQCTTIEFDKAGCEKAAIAHWENDPYYPRPDREADRALWNAFSEEYVRVGKIALAGTRHDKLPKMYIEAVVKECKKRYPKGPPTGAPPPSPTVAAPQVGTAPPAQVSNENAMMVAQRRPKKGKGRSRGYEINLEDLAE